MCRIYEWENNDLDQLILNKDYDKIKQLSYQEKLYVLKYMNVSYWQVRNWEQCDRDLLYDVNIYINRNYQEKLNWANTNNDKINKITDILCNLTDNDFSNTNVFYYLTADVFNLLPFNIKQILVKKLQKSYKDEYIAFLSNFIYVYTGNTTVADCNSGYLYEKYRHTSFKNILKYINLVRYVCPDCEYDERFISAINSTLYCCLVINAGSKTYFEENINCDDKDKIFYNKVFTSKTKIRDAKTIVFLLNWFNNILTAEDEKELLRKFTFKQNEETYGNNELINLLNQITITESNKQLIDNLKFELALK